MQYRQLGRTGVFVSPLCLGTINFGGPPAETDTLRGFERAELTGRSWSEADAR